MITTRIEYNLAYVYMKSHEK